MKKIYRNLLIVSGLGLVLVGGAGFAAKQWVDRETSPEALVRHLEKSFNCRAEIATTRVGLFSFPATLEVTGLRLLPRDKENEKPAKDRKPPKKIETLLLIPILKADLSLPALLSREIRIGNLTLTGVEAATVRKKNGENTLATLIGKPPAPPPDPNAPPAAPSAPKEKAKPFAAALTLAELKDAKLSVRNEKKKQLIQISDLNLSLTNLSYASALPVAANPATDGPPSVMESSLHLTSVDLPTQREQMDITIAVRSTLPPIQQAANADGTTLDLTFKAGSYLDRIPTLEKLGKKLGKLKDQIGLDLTSFPVSGRLLRDTAVKAKMTGGLLIFEEDTNFNFDTCRIKLKKGSSFNPDDQSHRFDGIFAANEQVSAEAIAGVEDYLKSKGESLGPIIRETILAKIVSDKGLLTIPFTSTEDIGRPEVNLSRSFEKAITEGLTDAASELLKDTLQGGDGIKGLLDSLSRESPDR